MLRHQMLWHCAVERSRQTRLRLTELRNDFAASGEHDVPEARILVLEIPFVRAALKVSVERTCDELICLWEVGRWCTVCNDCIVHTRFKPYVASLRCALIPHRSHSLNDSLTRRLCCAMLEEIEKIFATLHNE